MSAPLPLCFSLKCLHIFRNRIVFIIDCSLIPISAKDSNEFWKQSGRSLLTGELIGLWKDGETKNLSELINIILSRDTRELVEELMDKAKPNASETKFLSSFKNLADETLSGVVQQMQESVTGAE